MPKPTTGAPMMFGGEDEWWVLLFVPVVWWIFLGPFAMLALGAWCGSAPGPRPRWWSVLVPSYPVVSSSIPMIFPLSQWDRAVLEDGTAGPRPHLTDVFGYLAGYVGGITLLPWLLAYVIARLVRFVRSRRRGPAGPRRPEPTPADPDGRGAADPGRA
ncbi:hypothetical protein RGF97_00300 [Streptomyces roseicoloratus]|uniref:Uncharacterized protein n=1 Tax=Streptomyces roseicoloratus TaxID=2508722 RepID=A0ABY9RN59_9ACTN|nr:hypothetical protein [Streptomyces roseicoloratus]WMX43623.1 hypothetical protein RGF97_00300 [Streptomyces roseicoloratus]